MVSFTPRPLYPPNHWIGGWVGPSTDLDDVEKNTLASIGTRIPTHRPVAEWDMFELLTAVSIKSMSFCFIEPCSRKPEISEEYIGCIFKIEK
jgi:hypothetical protein